MCMHCRERARLIASHLAFAMPSHTFIYSLPQHAAYCGAENAGADYAIDAHTFTE